MYLKRWGVILLLMCSNAVYCQDLGGVSSNGLASEIASIVSINDYWNNRITYKVDDYNHWQTPMESLGLGTGNCKDYAIAKYYNLISSGVAYEKIKLAYVKINIDGKIIPHMIVLYETQDDKFLVLDNVAEVILPLEKRKDISVIFIFDQDNIYNPDFTLQRKGINAIKQWVEVVDKMKKAP